MILQFKLTMPNVGSWNGKWTGEGGLYVKFRTVKKEEAEKILEGKDENSFHYSWPDGWGANVSVKQVTSAEKQKRKRASRGFYGYDWMIDSIIKYGKILNTKDQKALEHL